ncbi:hypothetical protein [Streptomyces qinglanensis]|uniref:hypothetical protein n=1 Tax=Streptomyces TaxID=1883 RepID=UPI0004853657|nr:hypothetical protein [Streptomyces qinglanensis]
MKSVAQITAGLSEIIRHLSDVEVVAGSRTTAEISQRFMQSEMLKEFSDTPVRVVVWSRV